MSVSAKAKITIEGLGEITSVTASSYSQFSEYQGVDYANSTISKKNNGENVYILGYSPLNSGDTYSEIYKGLLSGEEHISGDTYSQGYIIGYRLQNPYRITVKGTKIKSIYIVFDNVEGVYATTIETAIPINGKSIFYNESSYFSLILQENDDNVSSVSSYYIDVMALNRPNSPVRIKTIIVNNEIVMSQNNGLLKYTGGRQSTSNNKMPNYGLVSQYGNVEFMDTPDGYFKKLANSGFLDRDVQIELFLEDNLIGTYIASNDWNYNSYNGIISVSFGEGKMAELQNTSMETRVFVRNVDAYQLFNELKKDVTLSKFSFDISSVTDWLKSIKIGFPYFEKGSLWEQLNKFCNMAQLRMYETPDGTIIAKRFE